MQPFRESLSVATVAKSVDAAVAHCTRSRKRFDVRFVTGSWFDSRRWPLVNNLPPSPGTRGEPVTVAGRRRKTRLATGPSNSRIATHACRVCLRPSPGRDEFTAGAHRHGLIHSTRRRPPCLTCPVVHGGDLSSLAAGCFSTEGIGDV